ncbi:hypothetical protein [Streptomyces sp. bgisy034]|uniref:hypothetical protein n=1 Tax=Streptomyces sp. bgisy034 TaxID=3413774 RepID=UPI003EB96B0F
MSAPSGGRRPHRSSTEVETEPRLQSYGSTGRQIDFTVVEGSLEEGRFVGVYGHRDVEGRPHQVDGVLGNGMARSLRTWRQAVLDRAPWPTTPASPTPASATPAIATSDV